MKSIILGGMVLTVSTIGSAYAHVTLEQQSAAANSNYKAVFRVGHGCNGSPTTSITVYLPESFVGFKPMPKASWTLEYQTVKLAVPYLQHETPITERIAAVTWRGGPLPDMEYDEFVMRGNLPATPGKYWIRVMQQCAKGQNDWSEIPVDGKPYPAFPAAQIEVQPAQEVTSHHH